MPYVEYRSSNPTQEYLLSNQELIFYFERLTSDRVMYGIKRAIAAAPPYELFPTTVLSDADKAALHQRQVETTRKVEAAWTSISQRMSKAADGACFYLPVYMSNVASLQQLPLVLNI